MYIIFIIAKAEFLVFAIQPAWLREGEKKGEIFSREELSSRRGTKAIEEEKELTPMNNNSIPVWILKNKESVCPCEYSPGNRTTRGESDICTINYIEEAGGPTVCSARRASLAKSHSEYRINYIFAHRVDINLNKAIRGKCCLAHGACLVVGFLDTRWKECSRRTREYCADSSRMIIHVIRSRIS